MGASASSAAAVRWTADDVAARGRLGTAFAKYAEVAKKNGLDGNGVARARGLKEQVQQIMGEEAKLLHLSKLAIEHQELKTPRD